MENRAKCKICKSVIQSYHAQDLVFCECGEIALDGGEAMKVYANDFSNVIRVDDNGNEIIPKVIEKEDEVIEVKEKVTKESLIGMLEEQVNAYERLPKDAYYSPVVVADLVSLMMILLSIFKDEK